MDNQELHVGIPIPRYAGKQIHNWVRDQRWPEGTELEHPKEYHITLLFAPDGDERRHDKWIDQFEKTEIKFSHIDVFKPGNKGYPYVLVLESPEISEHAEGLQDRAKWMGLSVTDFPGGYKPHITVAYGPNPTLPQMRVPQFVFDVGPSEVSPSRPKEANENLNATQVLDHLALANIAHNLHYKYQEGGMDAAQAQDYAVRLLRLVGYQPDELTTKAVIDGWQKMYPQDQLLLEGSKPRQLPPTVSALKPLYHWMDRSDIHQWLDPAYTGSGQTWLTEMGDDPEDGWNPDVPYMEHPVRLTIDPSYLDPNKFDSHWEGWQNNHLYKDIIPPEAVADIKSFKAPESWFSTLPSEVNSPEDHWPEFGERPPDEMQHRDLNIPTDWGRNRTGNSLPQGTGTYTEVNPSPKPIPGTMTLPRNWSSKKATLPGPVPLDWVSIPGTVAKVGATEPPPRYKNIWEPGETAHFQYGCHRGHDSQDADLWYRSHQPVTIVGPADTELSPYLKGEEPREPGDEWMDDPEQRMIEGMPLGYFVRFHDGHEGTVMEDELSTDPRYFEPQGGPPPLDEIRLFEPDFQPHPQQTFPTETGTTGMTLQDSLAQMRARGQPIPPLCDNCVTKPDNRDYDT